VETIPRPVKAPSKVDTFVFDEGLLGEKEFETGSEQPAAPPPLQQSNKVKNFKSVDSTPKHCADQVRQSHHYDFIIHDILEHYLT
jgi:hypothetical protein